MLGGFLLSVAGASALLLLLFALWGRAAERPRRPGGRRLLFTGWGGIVEREVFQRLVAEFERRNPDVSVDYRPVPRDYVTKLKLMFAGGTPPDVFYVPDGDFPGFAVTGQALNLQPFIKHSAIIREDEFWSSALKRYRFDGRVFGRGPLYALPKDIGPTAMYVNLDLLRAQGIPFPLAPSDDGRGEAPLTWDEALALWTRLTRDLDGDGRVDQWGTHGMPLQAVVWSNGGDFLSADGRRFTLPDDPKALQAVEWLVSLQTTRHVAPMERQQQSIPVDTLFLTGRLATFIDGRWKVPQFRNASFAWDVAPIPVSPRTHKLAGWSGSVGLAISHSCRSPEAAWRLVEFLAGAEGQKVQAATGFQIPNQRALAATDAFLQPGRPPRHAEVFIRAAGYQQPGPPTRTPNNEWWDALNRGLGPAFRGERSVSEAVRSCREEVQEKLDQAWREPAP